MDKYEEAVRIVNNYIRGLKECYENACDIVGDKSKTPAVRAKHARNAEEFYTLSIIQRDGVLADENDEVIEDVEDAVGIDSLNHFGEYEDDSVFVRNDARKCDYEILLDQRTYSEVVEDMPHQMEV